MQFDNFADKKVKYYIIFYIHIHIIFIVYRRT